MTLLIVDASTQVHDDPASSHQTQDNNHNWPMGGKRQILPPKPLQIRLDPPKLNFCAVVLQHFTGLPSTQQTAS